VYSIPTMLKVRQIRWLLVSVLVVLLAAAFMSEPVDFGVSLRWSSEDYHFAGGTSPWILLVALSLIVLYLWLIHADPPVTASPLPGVVRRFCAFFVDFIIAMVTFAPILGIVPMLVEWRRTGVFQRHFERYTPVHSDSLVTNTVMIATVPLLVLYYAIPLAYRKPSPGTCILGYQVVPDDERATGLGRAILRTLLGMVALSAWPLSLLLARDRKNGKYWVDRVFKTHAVRLV